MDFAQRLKNMEERRGETIDEMMAKREQETGVSLNDEIIAFAASLANATPDEVDTITANLGGMEHYHPYEHMRDGVFFFTGMESISDGIVRIYDRIIAFIKRWIKILADADFKLSLTTGLHQTTLENIRTEMRTTARRTRSSPTFPVVTRIEGISVNYRPITSAAMLLNSLSVLSKVAELYFTHHDSTILRQVNQVVAAVNGRLGYQRVAELMNEVSPVRLTSNSIMKLDSDKSLTPHLLGNHRLVVTNDDKHSTERADVIHGVRIKMERSQLTNTNPVDVVHFEHFDIPMAEALLTKCDSILGTLSDSNNGPRRHGRRQGMQSLLACIEKIKEEAEHGRISDEESNKTIALLESYTAWIADPYTSLYAYVLRTVKATLNVVASNNA